MLRKDKLKIFQNKTKQDEMFICGFNKDLKAITSFDDKGLFFVSQNKETKAYHYTLLSEEQDERFYLVYALVFMKVYLMIKHNIDALPLMTLESINKINLSTSANTLSDLYIKLYISTQTLCNYSTFLEDMFFNEASLTISGTYSNI